MAKVYFYYAAMNAGKSTVLLQSAHNYRERGMDVILLTSGLDNRYKTGQIDSRIGLSSEAIIYNQDTDLTKLIQAETQQKKMSCILVDEAQFLTKEQVKSLSVIADQMNIPVLAYGLRTDFRGELFPGSQYLLAWAEELIEIKTICRCSRKATMNARLSESGEMVTQGDQIEIGGNDRYEAVCWGCYIKKMKGVQDAHI